MIADLRITDSDGDYVTLKARSGGSAGLPYLVTAGGVVLLTIEDTRALRDRLSEYLDDTPVEPRSFQAGDRVRVTGPLVWTDGTGCNGRPRPGREGLVVDIDDNGDCRVQFGDASDRGWIASTSLTLVKDEPVRAPDTATLDRLVEEFREALQRAFE